MYARGDSMLDKSYYDKVDLIIEEYGAKPSSLIPIIQDIQAEYRYLPAELLSYVAGKIGIRLRPTVLRLSMKIFHSIKKESMLLRYVMVLHVMYVSHLLF